MTIIKPFRGICPLQNLVEQVVSCPYDALNFAEIREEAVGNEESLYHVIRPEIDFPIGMDEHNGRVYQEAAENFRIFQGKGWLVQDDKENYYAYIQTMNGKTQYGLVVEAYVPDYMNGVIKKHELTRRDKGEDRMKYVRVNNADTEPVFFTYPDNATLDAVTAHYMVQKPVYDFIVPGDGLGHTLWIIDKQEDTDAMAKEFGRMPVLYIANGYHHSAAAALVGVEKTKQNPNHRGDEEYDYFVAVCFPASQSTIIDYNRMMKSLNGMTPEQFLAAVSKNFAMEEKGTNTYKPAGLHSFSLYLGGKWYSLTVKPGTYNNNDPIDALDTTTLSNLILDGILDIRDLCPNKRIDFVDGMHDLGRLKKWVDSGEMGAALTLYPAPMKQSMGIADTDNIMPPKTTWFEPRLCSGLVIHKLD